VYSVSVTSTFVLIVFTTYFSGYHFAMSFPTISQRDRIVIVMGPTGAGKSTFIESATGQTGKTVGHGWQSCTAEIRSVRVTHPTNGHPVIFVDTPGFDDTFKTDTEILSMISVWLVKAKKNKSNLATILYMHRISDNRMSGSAMKNLRLFSSICGQEAMKNVVIVTTMWSKVSEVEGTERERDLKRDVWNDMLSSGCSIEHFKDTHRSAWDIVGSIEKKEQTEVQLPREIVDTRLRLNETQVGTTLNKELEKLIQDQKTAARSFRKLAKTQDNALLVEQLNEIETKIVQTQDQLHELKIPITRRVRLLWKRKTF